MFYLHQNMMHTRVQEEFDRLMTNGKNHRDVLVENYSELTIHHIVMMEKNENRNVIITDKDGNIIDHSEHIKLLEDKLLIVNGQKIEMDEIIIDDWKNSPYIASAHPYEIDENTTGYVVMFQNTSVLQQMVKNMNLHFAIAGATSVIVLFIVYAILSKIITKPLIRMRDATEQISKGDFDVSLPQLSNDELGELSHSIQTLANDLNRMKSERNEFLASVAHELSTPLTYIIGYSKVAMRDELDKQEREKYLAIIAEESNRLKVLVKNLLDLAKMDENSFTVTKERFPIKPFLEKLYSLVVPSYELKNIRLTLECKNDFEVEADPTRLEQIILNLLDNALKYSKENGQVILQAFQNEHKTIIKVIDAGIGIAQEEANRIFEKLYRVEKSRSREFGGSGLGLAIVKELVDAHDGTIHVESELGKGSTFTISI